MIALTLPHNTSCINTNIILIRKIPNTRHVFWYYPTLRHLGPSPPTRRLVWRHRVPCTSASVPGTASAVTSTCACMYVCVCVCVCKPLPTHSGCCPATLPAPPGRMPLLQTSRRFVEALECNFPPHCVCLLALSERSKHRFERVLQEFVHQSSQPI